MGFDRLRVKSNARKFWELNRGDSIVSLLILMGLSVAGTVAFYIVYFIIMIIFGAGSMALYSQTDALDPPSYVALIGPLMMFPLLIALTFFFLNVVVMGVLDWYRRRIYERCSLSEIFRPFKQRYMSNVATMALVSVYTLLWTMLLYVPGIIKSYSYSMTTYIKMEFPHLSPNQAIKLSEKITDGHKAELFYMDLTFLGWFMLSAFTYYILGIVFVFPYYYSAKAFAYEEIKADAMANGRFELPGMLQE